MADVAVPSIATATPSDSDTVLGVQGGAVKRFSVSALPFTQDGTGAVARTALAKMKESVSVADFGAVGDGVTDDTAAIVAALASLTSGGALYFPPGTYVVQRGNGAAPTDTIIADNVTIYGAGAVISGYKDDGTTPNNAGNQYYNVFQATNRSGVTIRDLAFAGYTTPVSLFGCSNVLIEGVSDTGLLANAGGYMRDKSLYLHQCTDVRVVGCRFLNVNSSVYLSGDGTTRTGQVVVSACHFEHNVAAGSFTAIFPVGVYHYYADDVVVSGCAFRNIYSSVDSGTTGTGMGYGVYEGDGTGDKLSVTGCTFQYDGNGSKNAIGICVNYARDVVVSGNAFRSESGGRMVNAVLVDTKDDGSIRNINGNTISAADSTTKQGICCKATTEQAARFLITGNAIEGCEVAIYVVNGLAKVLISNNFLDGQYAEGIRVGGSATNRMRFPVISGNRISGCANNALYLFQMVSPQIVGNTILDGNTGATAGDAGAAIYMMSFAFGSLIANNTIGNTAFGGGAFTYGVQNASSVTSRIFKDISHGNSFLGLSPNTQFGRFSTTAPTVGIFDVNKGDFVQNVQLGAGGVPGWYCVEVRTPTLAADASSASTTITLSSTGSVSAGDVILLCKSADPYAGDYADTNKWHADTVASVTNSTQLVLTNGIPAGDGTYTAGTASVRIARFKAAAAVAA